MTRKIAIHIGLILRGDLLIAATSAYDVGQPSMYTAMRAASISDTKAVADLFDWAMAYELEELPDQGLPRGAQIKAAGCRSYKSFMQGSSHVLLMVQPTTVHVNGSYNRGPQGFMYSGDRQALIEMNGDLPGRMLGLLRDPSLMDHEPRATLLDDVLIAGRKHVPKGRSDVDLIVRLDDAGNATRMERCWTDHECDEIGHDEDLALAVKALRDEEVRHGWTPWNRMRATLHPRRRTDRIMPEFRWDRAGDRWGALWEI